MRRLAGSTPFAAILGLLAGGLVLAVLLVRAPDAAEAGQRTDLDAGDVITGALDAFAAGDHVVVVPGGEKILSPEAEQRVEAVIERTGAPLYVLVSPESWNTGYRQAGHAMDQMQAHAEVDGVLVLWETTTGERGDVAPTFHHSMPSTYELVEAGVLSEEDAEVYDRIRPYDLTGEPEARLTEWAEALPPEFADYRPESVGQSDSTTGDTILGVVGGALTALLVAGVVWIAIGIVRVRTGRRFTNRPHQG